ncbi:MAG: hypothetical protein D3925_01455 [Candidatus Electrothrix sp. AR5]|nr:hypothetical protein [Candidatus Electrothrix sp. AR5]
MSNSLQIKTDVFQEKTIKARTEHGIIAVMDVEKSGIFECVWFFRGRGEPEWRLAFLGHPPPVDY